MHFAALGRAFQADRRGFRPIEGGPEGGGSVLWIVAIKSSTKARADGLAALPLA